MIRHTKSQSQNIVVQCTSMHYNRCTTKPGTQFLRILNPHKIGAPSPNKASKLGEYILILPSHDPILLMRSGMLCMGYLAGLTGRRQRHEHMIWSFFFIIAMIEYLYGELRGLYGYISNYFLLLCMYLM